MTTQKLTLEELNHVREEHPAFWSDLARYVDIAPSELKHFVAEGKILLSDFLEAKNTILSVKSEIEKINSELSNAPQLSNFRIQLLVQTKRYFHRFLDGDIDVDGLKLINKQIADLEDPQEIDEINASAAYDCYRFIRGIVPTVI